MNEVQLAKFRFIDFEIEKFCFEKPSSNENELAMNLTPSGEFFTTESRFRLILNFEAKEIIDGVEKTGDSNISVLMISQFKFENVHTIEEIPSFFYKNSIAIVFPYLRAFISNMTLQANVDILLLPLLNLSNLESELINNTTLKE